MPATTLPLRTGRRCGTSRSGLIKNKSPPAARVIRRFARAEKPASEFMITQRPAQQKSPQHSPGETTGLRCPMKAAGGRSVCGSSRMAGRAERVASGNLILAAGAIHRLCWFPRPERADTNRAASGSRWEDARQHAASPGRIVVVRQ